MTDTTDAAIGAVTGLVAVGIMANVAGKMLGNRRSYPKQRKVKKTKKMNWL